MKQQYDQHAKPLPPLEVGEPVYVKPSPQENSQMWKEGIAIEKLSPRLYTIAMEHLQDAKPTETAEKEQGSGVNDKVTAEPRRSTRMKKAPDLYPAGFN